MINKINPNATERGAVDRVIHKTASEGVTDGSSDASETTG